MGHPKQCHPEHGFDTMGYPESDTNRLESLLLPRIPSQQISDLSIDQLVERDDLSVGYDVSHISISVGYDLSVHLHYVNS